MASKKLSVWALLVLCAGGCSRERPAGPGLPPPAEKPRAESELAVTTLTPEQAKSLAIRTEAVTVRKVQQHQPLAGWVTPKPGQEVTLTAPVSGYLQAGRKGVPAPGMASVAGQELWLLQPVLSPLDQLQLATLKRGIEGELAKARESVTVADSELKRVEDLHRQKLRALQDVEQARAKLKHAQADVDAAEDKLKLFASGKDQTLPALAIQAPRAGTVLSVHAAPGQYVPPAAPLLTLIDLAPAWLRVPVSEFDLPRVDKRQPVLVRMKFAGEAKPKELRAKPVASAPVVDPMRHSADLLYELEQPAALAKDQMASVLVPLGEERLETVVPYGAVVFDAYGGVWVYLDRSAKDAAKLTYERRRVELGPSIGDGVVVRPQLRDGDRVVVEGVAALFSREFFRPPVPQGAEVEVQDDDD